MTNEEKIIERVRKLMALATSSNEHEAAAAASKAQELLLKYNLDMAKVEAKEEAEDVIKFDYYEKDSSNWKKRLMYAVAKGMCCDLVTSTGRHAYYYVFGKPSNVEVVKYLYEYLDRELIRISPRPLGSSLSNAFRQGAVSVINKRITETFQEFQKASDATRALIVVQDKAVQELKNSTFPKLGKSRGGSIGDYAGYRAGQEAGKNIPLRHGLNRNSGGQLLLK